MNVFSQGTLGKLEREVASRFGSSAAVEVGQSRKGWFGKVWRGDGTCAAEVDASTRTGAVDKLLVWVRIFGDDEHEEEQERDEAKTA